MFSSCCVSISVHSSWAVCLADYNCGKIGGLRSSNLHFSTSYLLEILRPLILRRYLLQWKFEQLRLILHRLLCCVRTRERVSFKVACGGGRQFFESWRSCFYFVWLCFAPQILKKTRPLSSRRMIEHVDDLMWVVWLSAYTCCVVSTDLHSLVTVIKLFVVWIVEVTIFI